MIRQARSYFVGAFSGVTLIGIAIGVFVLLVSAQVFQNFPLELSGHTEKAVAPAKALPGGGQGTDGATVSTGGTAAPTGSEVGAAASASSAKARRHHADHKSGTGPAIVADADLGPSTGSDEATGATGGSHASPPSSTGESGSSGASSGGSSSSSSSSSSGSGAATGSSGSSGSTGSSGGSSSAGSGATTAGVKKVPEQVVGTVDETVGTVDEKVLGGTLEKTGVKQATEEIVNNVAGPESAVGKTVEGVTEVVGGLLGGGGH